ncbi:hypothetical protein F7Q99_40120 [Streptomyces kaniharaensis]|uniref:Uncharacterized protein n=1 Tax=Streptomyces kaniharaensis TaxID=212423 RepID=A0A6N7L2A0_9ACTN|nr:hypothetical protein [Streptomyces kaniharaensis]MQS17997.1 hypothetical protein [Streptomyces kaniharaensis]MQS18052.1 hypothetical protein [Streptomyces kaniharaensis]MQS18067.1 hypothetical protein [Streptomyces kaniharaensis]MQS18156.1 hypothetical protein [Streptomyces kaniharaensis]MQS18175.1 hypothetical protein [Streptomyces kaniharaensis]
MDIPEVAQAAALAEVAKLGHDRGELLRQADELLTRIKPAAVKAVQAGAGRNRVRELAGVSTTLWYEWLDEAGIQVRPRAAKKTATKKATTSRKRETS